MTDKPKPKRRWLQFSLRTLFIVVTLFCIWMGITAKRAREQKQAVETIREAGGRVTYDYQLTGSVKPSISKWLRELIGDDYLARVVFVALLGRSGTDAVLVHLEGLTDLRGLSLLGTDITDAGLAHVGACTNLETLDLRSTSITNIGLVHLKRLTKLRKLDLSHSPVTEVGIDALRKNLPEVEIRRDRGVDNSPIPIRLPAVEIRRDK